MKTSRQRMLDYIQSHHLVTIGDLCQALQTSEANVRHHLTILQEQGLVTAVGQRPAAGRGRPSQIFAPSERSLGDNLPALAGALLGEFDLLPEAERSALLARLAERLQAALPPPSGPPAAAHSAPRLVQATTRLNSAHYRARWEAHASAPRLILGRCPYAAVIHAHPWLCAVDAALLASLLGAPLEHSARLAPDGQGGTHCVFTLPRAAQ